MKRMLKFDSSIFPRNVLDFDRQSMPMDDECNEQQIEYEIMEREMNRNFQMEENLHGNVSIRCYHSALEYQIPKKQDDRFQ